MTLDNGKICRQPWPDSASESSLIWKSSSACYDSITCDSRNRDAAFYGITRHKNLQFCGNRKATYLYQQTEAKRKQAQLTLSANFRFAYMQHIFLGFLSKFA
ncbi:uncharacterized protein [Elaeis guineensis]